jgi:chemotaxis protein MotB
MRTVGKYKRVAGPRQNHERWLVSYADFITLLFAFFVVMFASSQTDRGVERVQESVKRALGEDTLMAKIASIVGGAPGNAGKGNAQMRGPGGQEPLTDAQENPKKTDLVPAMEDLRERLAAEIAAGEMSITMTERGLVVSLRQAAFFSSGTDEIPPEALPKVSMAAEVIRNLPNPVRLEGHTDSNAVRVGGRFASNWELSAARSIAMMELLVSCCGVARERMSIAGYAENAPIAENATEEGRRQNRRVDIVVLNETGLAAEPTQSAGSQVAH